MENIKNLSNNTVFVNSVTDIDTKKDSFLEINKLQDYSSNERTIDTTNINQEKQAQQQLIRFCLVELLLEII